MILRSRKCKYKYVYIMFKRFVLTQLATNSCSMNCQTVLILILGVILLIEVVLNYLQMAKNNSIKEDMKAAEFQQVGEFELEQENKNLEKRIKLCLKEIGRYVQIIKKCRHNSSVSSKKKSDVKNPDVTSRAREVSTKSHKELQNIIMIEQEKTDECFYRRKELSVELDVCNGNSGRQVKEEPFKDKNFLDRIKNFVMFIGYARSGHSIVAALLDAHPHIAISHELHIIQIWEKSYRNDSSKTRNDLFREIIDNTAATISDEKGFRSPNLTRKYYTLDVPGLYQGKYQDYLQIIGDKKGGALVSSMKKYAKKMKENEELKELEEFEKYTGYPLKIIHIVRNPYDNIATKFLYGVSQQVRKEAATNETVVLRDNKQLKIFTERHLRCYQEIPKFINYFGERMLTLQHEDLIKSPRLFLTRICNFFEIYCPPDYLEKASEIVFDSPTKSRHSVEWSKEMNKEVEKAIKQYDFLQGYTFAS